MGPFFSSPLHQVVSIAKCAPRRAIGGATNDDAKAGYKSDQHQSHFKATPTAATEILSSAVLEPAGRSFICCGDQACRTHPIYNPGQMWPLLGGLALMDMS